MGTQLLGNYLTEFYQKWKSSKQTCIQGKKTLGMKSDNSSPFSPSVFVSNWFDCVVSGHHQQEAHSLRDKFNRAPLLFTGPGLGLLLHQRGQRRKAELQSHRTAVHLRPAADSSGHVAVH